MLPNRAESSIQKQVGCPGAFHCFQGFVVFRLVGAEPSEPLYPFGKDFVAFGRGGFGDLRQEPEKLIIDIEGRIGENGMVVLDVTPYTAGDTEVFDDLRNRRPSRESSVKPEETE